MRERGAIMPKHGLSTFFDAKLLTSLISSPHPASSQELLPMLSALSLVGRSVTGCLGKVLGALSAKKAVDQAKIARGLESILSGQSY